MRPSVEVIQLLLEAGAFLRPSMCSRDPASTDAFVDPAYCHIQGYTWADDGSGQSIEQRSERLVIDKLIAAAVAKEYMLLLGPSSGKK